MRSFLGVAAVAVLATPCSATSWRQLTLPELVGSADVIVLGTVTKVDKEYHVRVAETLAGNAVMDVTKDVSFAKWDDTRCKVNDRQIFFLVIREKEMSLICPYAYEAPNRAKEVRRLMDMKTHPKKYLDDPKQANTPEFLVLLGYAFAKRDQVGRMTKATAIEHLRRNLSSDDTKSVLMVIVALERMGGKETAMSAVPLLRHSDEKVRIAAVKFLEWSKDKRAVEPLCRALDAVEKDGEFGHFLGRALGTLGDPAAVPALARANKRGIRGWTGWALGTLGSERCFEALLIRAEKQDSMDALCGIHNLVHRSNKKFEPWMEKCAWSEKTGLENKEKWRAWWEANKSDFKVIKTAKEAFGWK